MRIFTEPLELRRLMSASIVDHVLVVDGTSKADDIMINIHRTNPALIDATVNGVTTLFKKSQIKRIRINGMRGNDSILINEKLYPVGLPSRIHGNGGNDTIIAGASKDQLYGDAGDDVLEGGGGADWLSGGTGHDHLYGQAGNDSFDENAKPAQTDRHYNEWALWDGMDGYGGDLGGDFNTIATNFGGAVYTGWIG